MNLKKHIQYVNIMTSQINILLKNSHNAGWLSLFVNSNDLKNQYKQTPNYMCAYHHLKLK